MPEPNRAIEAGHRRSLVLCGDAHWCRHQAEVLLGPHRSLRCLWLADQAPSGFTATPPHQAVVWLGREVDLLVVDAHAGLDVDALGAAGGVLRGGGLFLLLTPPLADWPFAADPEYARLAPPGRAGECRGRFLQRLARLIRTTPTLCVHEQGQQQALPELAPANPIAPNPAFAPACNQEQQAVIAAVCGLVGTDRPRPLVLTADRGRGKSAAFGIAAGTLLASGTCRRILVTAPRANAAEALFEHARRVWPQAERDGLHLRAGHCHLEFVAPDQLLHELPPADLLLVDEAAAIPTPLLTDFLSHYPRIAYATTVHGYEGTGRGFALRFTRVLDRHGPGWTAMQLREPVRWKANDPLEAFLFRALCLDAEPATLDKGARLQREAVAFEQVQREQLCVHERLLGEVFGLLVRAHYRTRPYDLRLLLDAPDLALYVLRWQGRVVATALVDFEGGIDADLAEQIYLGLRRPRGQLLAQSLSAHVGMSQGACLRGARIMRIAVHPALQRRGLGTRMVREIHSRLADADLDWLGVSFGADAELLRFWTSAGFEPLRIGLSRDARSGAHSALLVRPFSPQAQIAFTHARERFRAQLGLHLQGRLSDLASELVHALLPEGGAATVTALMTEADWRDVLAVAFARRGCDDSALALHRLLHAAQVQGAWDLLSAAQQDLLIGRLVRGRSWTDLSTMLNSGGRRHAQAELRRAVRQLARALADAGVLAEIARIQARMSAP